MRIKTGRFNFGKDKGSGPRTQDQIVDFGAGVKLTNAVAVVTGANFGFSPNDDHNFGLTEITVRGVIVGPTSQSVQVTATFGVRDWSGDWDDYYEGWIEYAVLAD
ncbi:MAG TPA: hypothetical protein VJ739_02720 [Gemmataceae bacterium]|nr:hypothetical protein [Gemmataceae bacterium]